MFHCQWLLNRFFDYHKKLFSFSLGKRLQYYNTNKNVHFFQSISWKLLAARSSSSEFFPCLYFVCTSKIQIASSDGCFCIFIFVRNQNTLPPSLPLICHALQESLIKWNVHMHTENSLLYYFFSSLAMKHQCCPVCRPWSPVTDEPGTADAGPVIPGRATCLGQMHPRPFSIFCSLCACARADDFKNLAMIYL